jgi:hypothetical protein
MPNNELHSWKEIVAYLRVTVRTAQIWEVERGLPVRRLPTSIPTVMIAAGSIRVQS